MAEAWLRLHEIVLLKSITALWTRAKFRDFISYYLIKKVPFERWRVLFYSNFKFQNAPKLRRPLSLLTSPASHVGVRI